MTILRDYQQNAIDYITNYLRNGGRRLCCVSPTGSGKTVIFSNLIQIYCNKMPIFLLVHKNDLILQASNHLSRNGIKHSIIGNKEIIKTCRKNNIEYCYGEYKNFTNVAICSVQTLVNRLEYIPSPRLIICDEFHHYCSPQFKKILNFYNQARIVGFTATPERLDGKGLGEIADDLYEVITVRELIERNYLSKYKVFAPQNIDMKGVGKVAGDFNKKEAKMRMDNTIIYGDVIKEYQKHCNNQPAIAFCINIEHSIQVAEEFKKAGYRAQALTSAIKDPQEVIKYIKMLGNRELDILTSCEMISEGTDIPIVSCALLLRPTMSFSLQKQQVGRVLRPAPNKEYAIILDFVGNIMRHGFPDDIVEWSLESKKLRIHKGENIKTNLICCPYCYALFNKNEEKCPYCGYEIPKKEIKIETNKNVELWEFNPEVERERILKELSSKHISELKTVRDFYDYAKAHNYKSGWAYLQCKRRGLIKK